MNTRLKKILLIDDNEAINFIHSYILDEINCCEEIIVKENGADAMEFLLSLVNDNIALPELIFIDINMPKMNAWEFMAEYKKLDLSQRSGSRVILLTSSIDPGDLAKAKSIEEITQVRDKPFDEEIVKELIGLYFGDS